jgi:hypothetical protein
MPGGDLKPGVHLRAPLVYSGDWGRPMTQADATGREARIVRLRKADLENRVAGGPVLSFCLSSKRT